MTSSSLKLLITGGNGQLAQALQHHPLSKQYTPFFYSKETLDIRDQATINNVIKQIKPDCIINTAAYTAVDKAEGEPERAIEINQLGARQLAIACQQHNIHLIHLSTDYVFDGEHTVPYHEEYPENPINVYGHSKYLGEQAVKLHNDHYTILRISGVFSAYGANFLKTILRLATEKSELRIVADQITCPTHASDIAHVIFKLATSSALGTYHFCSAEPTSWHQFASAIIEEAKRYITLPLQTIRAINTEDYPTLAKRPAYSVLDCRKIKRDLAIEQPSWQEAIKQTIKEMYS